MYLDFLNISEEIDLDTKHKIAFKKLSKYFLETHNLELDKSGSDISRLCFLSFDEDIIIKDNYEKFEIVNSDLMHLTINTSYQIRRIKHSNNRDALYNPLGRNNIYDRKIMSDIIRYLTNKNLSITYTYQEWCKVAMAISNCFTFDIGLKYFIKLSKLDGKKFNEIHCTNFLNNCYETRSGSVSFGSIIYLANDKGFKTKQQKNGVGKTD